MSPARAFRTQKSLDAEAHSRKLVPKFLEERGYVVERDERTRNGQSITVWTPEGTRLTMRVKLCWNREGSEGNRTHSYSAVQLLAKVAGQRWTESIAAKVEREASHGVTHLLLVQRDGKEIRYAALVPLSEVVDVWRDQRDLSNRLITQGRLGRRRKNHAMNGSSPTIWLQDDRAPEVAKALWSRPRVQDLSTLPQVDFSAFIPEEIEADQRYPEGARHRIIINSYERNRVARRQCIDHYGTTCFVCGIDFGKVYGDEFQGLIHVHHLQALATVGAAYLLDPIEDLRPVCPNCHAMVHHGGRLRDINEVQRVVEAANSSSI